VIGGTVFSINGGPFHPVRFPDNSEVTQGDVIATTYLLLFFNGTAWLIIAGGSRVLGAAPLLKRHTHWYVNSVTGHDDNYDGTQPNIGAGRAGPFRTINRAGQEQAKYNMNGFNQHIHVADGFYEHSTMPSTNGVGACFLVGNEGNPNQVQITNPAGDRSALYINGGQWDVTGFRFATGTGGADGITCTAGRVDIHTARFGPCGRKHVVVSGSGSIVAFSQGTIYIEAGADSTGHLMAESAAFMTVPVGTPSLWPVLTVLGAVNFTQGFAAGGALGIIQSGYATINGYTSVTGPRYFASMNSAIQNFSGIPFPGTLPGVLELGGQYSGA
jgi:hypothetical protein